MKKTLIFLIIIILATAAIYSYRDKLPKWLFFGKENSLKLNEMVSIKWFPFNRKDALDEWQEKIFKGKVLYVVRPQMDKGLLSAESDKAASGLFYRITYDAQKHPMVSWKWLVKQFPAKNPDTKSSKGWIERDDYAVRFYVIFPSFYFMNTKCLEYVWDETLPKGKILTSPYFKNIKLIVVESGEENLGKWVFNERDIVKDFAAAFGRPLKQKVGAIAIMTDADNTQSSALAEYSEIKVGYEKNEK